MLGSRYAILEHIAAKLNSKLEKKAEDLAVELHKPFPNYSECDYFVVEILIDIPTQGGAERVGD